MPAAAFPLRRPTLLRTKVSPAVVPAPAQPADHSAPSSLARLPSLQPLPNRCSNFDLVPFFSSPSLPPPPLAPYPTLQMTKRTKKVGVTGKYGVVSLAFVLVLPAEPPS